MSGTSGEDEGLFQRETERIVHEAAQGLRTLDDATAGFSGLAVPRRRQVLQTLAGYPMQAHVPVFTVADTRRRETRRAVGR
ncbi:hypothetical protein ACIRP0_08000 [Streptomyces sp. NPDC101733]|uniref:hypothetical protein n=1 Tax=unclassified Streptomyces TaxID=2593676 RepID=UPI0038213EEF